MLVELTVEVNVSTSSVKLETLAAPHLGFAKCIHVFVRFFDVFRSHVELYISSRFLSFSCFRAEELIVENEAVHDLYVY